MLQPQLARVYANIAEQNENLKKLIEETETGFREELEKMQSEKDGLEHHLVATTTDLTGKLQEMTKKNEQYQVQSKLEM